MSNEKNTILSQWDISQRLKRMAYEIAEDNHEASEIFLIGIKNKGFALAEVLQNELQQIIEAKVRLEWVKIYKPDPLKETIVSSIEPTECHNRILIFVDDVANTGRTGFYAMKPFMDALPAKVRFAVLVDRKHKLFPICSDFVGLSLSTTIQENIEVVFEGNDAHSVYLN
jgi:pyrimidine operon attenuation protein/uracil phosphoribosyltransferase